jgi:hypothetical protein
LGAGCIAALLVVLTWRSRCPIDVRIAYMEPGVMVDDSWIVLLDITNSGPGYVHCERWYGQAEAKLANGWVQVTNAWQSGFSLGPGPGGKSQLLVLMPPGTKAYRLRVNYSPETLKELLGRLAGQYAPGLLNKFPAIRKSLSPPPWPAPRPPREWTESTVEVAVPQMH